MDGIPDKNGSSVTLSERKPFIGDLKNFLSNNDPHLLCSAFIHGLQLCYGFTSFSLLIFSLFQQSQKINNEFKYTSRFKRKDLIQPCGEKDEIDKLDLVFDQHEGRKMTCSMEKGFNQTLEVNEDSMECFYFHDKAAQNIILVFKQLIQLKLTISNNPMTRVKKGREGSCFQGYFLYSFYGYPTSDFK